MPSFLLYDKCRVWFDDTGNVLADGYLKFYVAGSTTPQDVYGNRALSTNNGDTIALDAAGKLEHECWADATDAYFIEVYNASDVKVGEISYREVDGGVGQTIPVPNDDEVLGGDGVNFIVRSFREVPDPTGNANKILGTDGDLVLWVARPSDGANGESDIENDDNGFSVGGIRVTYGSGTGVNAGGRTQTANVVFPVEFGAAPDIVLVTVTNSVLSSAGNMPTYAVTSKSTTGCTIKFTMGELDDTRSQYDFTSAVQFNYVAYGEKA